MGKYRGELERLSEGLEMETVTMRHVDQMIASLSVGKVYKKVTALDADAELNQYFAVLEDLPVEDLRSAYPKLRNNGKFLPKPDEVRKAVLQEGATREYVISRARHLLRMDALEWKPRGPVMTPEEFAQAKAELERKGD